jgi:hypothetical protein
MKNTKKNIPSLIYLFLVCFTFKFQISFADDSLRLIELTSSGQSEAIEIPSGHIFTFGMFASDSNNPRPDDVVGIVEYNVPDKYIFEDKRTDSEFLNYFSWYLGPAKVSLKTSLSSGARMQLYVRRLPSDVVSGILSVSNPSHVVNIPSGKLLTSFLGYELLYEIPSIALTRFQNHLTFKSDTGINYGISKMSKWNLVYAVPNPRSRGSSRLQDTNAEASDVVSGYFYDLFDYVTPTADFCGPGNATFSLPPTEFRNTDIAFYCYKITSAKINTK